MPPTKNPMTSKKRKPPAISGNASKKVRTSSGRAQKATVMSEEEDEESLINDGAVEVEELDSDGNTVKTYPLRRSHSVATSDAEDIAEDVEEDDKAELKHMKARWTSPMYAFFDPVPSITYVKDRKCHEFKCSAKGCKQIVHRYLDTGDAQSTGNMHKHAVDVKTAREKVVKGYLKSGKITASFERKNKGTVTYSHVQHTKMETRAEIVRWVSESLRPFNIVDDACFKSLMKTGRPGYQLPSPRTVSCDVKLVFARARNRMAKMLQEYEGDLNFATDAWSSPNHRAFIALTVHLLLNGEPISILLDFLEVAESHSGLNLAKVFAQVLDNFGISEKILSVTCDNASANDVMIQELERLLPEFPGETNHTRCFAHIVNLVAKSLLKQFDTKKGGAGADSGAEAELDVLAEDIDIEDMQMHLENAAVAAEGDEVIDEEEGWVDEVAELTADEKKELEKSILPVRLVLVKLRKVSYKIVHSTTKLLPA
ncbi:hypothetical protein EWM64_g5785 [Hericium alpestre]|uniref:BED-type domain-containing protein n=1 Tax=Hericium alpestre TaxID=135208 RepID=A0A4Y9ZXM4_9AGAM|nr:hypothetical protein EWM64_g5785 [Hericium alpestre]